MFMTDLVWNMQEAYGHGYVADYSDTDAAQVAQQWREDAPDSDALLSAMYGNDLPTDYVIAEDFQDHIQEWWGEHYEVVTSEE